MLQIKWRFSLVFLLTFISFFALTAFLVKCSTNNNRHFLAYILIRVSNYDGTTIYLQRRQKRILNKKKS